MVTILMVEDEREIRRIVRAYFSKIQGYRLLEASCAAEALEMLGENPDIILLDIMMPGQDGLQLCPVIRKRWEGPILFLTARSSEADLLQGFSAGADDYITKPFSVKELHARIDAHLRKEGRLRQSRRVPYGALWIDHGDRTAGSGEALFSLTRKEFDILALLCLNYNRVFAKELIYEKIWGYDADGDACTAVTEHVKRIRKKIGAACAEHLETVWGVGYRWKN